MIPSSWRHFVLTLIVHTKKQTHRNLHHRPGAFIVLLFNYVITNKLNFIMRKSTAMDLSTNHIDFFKLAAINM
jgi:hypothetical protein